MTPIPVIAPAPFPRWTTWRWPMPGISARTVSTTNLSFAAARFEPYMQPYDNGSDFSDASISTGGAINRWQEIRGIPGGYVDTAGAGPEGYGAGFPFWNHAQDPAFLSGYQDPVQRCWILDFWLGAQTGVGGGNRDGGLWIGPRNGVTPNLGVGAGGNWPTVAATGRGGILVWLDGGYNWNVSVYDNGNVVLQDFLAVGIQAVRQEWHWFRSVLVNDNADQVGSWTLYFDGVELAVLDPSALGLYPETLIPGTPSGGWEQDAGYYWGLAFKASTTGGLMGRALSRWGSFLPDGTPLQQGY